jgi:surface polysaccharide O-acyltransferase-like enzyme
MERARPPSAQPVVLAAAATERTAWLDLARVLAIVAVLVVHVTMNAVNGARTPEGSASWWAANVLNSSSRWCVPVFLMVSGALLLDPRKTDRPRDFYRRRLARIGVPVLVWTAVYLAFRRLYLGEDVTAGEAARDVASGTPFLQLYFLYVLLGLYLLTPFLRIILRACTRRMQIGFAGILLALGAADQVAGSLLGAGDSTAATRFLPFAGYYVAGWILRDLVLSRPALVAAAGAWGGGVVVTVALVGLTSASAGWGSEGRYLYGFLSPAVIAMSLSAFVLLRAAGLRLLTPARPGLSKAMQRLSGWTFGVYLVHPLVLFPLARAVPLPSDFGGFLAVFTLQLLVTALGSVLLTVLLQRLPVLRATV